MGSVLERDREVTRSSYGSRPRTPQDWATEIDRALKFRRQFGLEEYWAQHEALFYNVHPSQGDSPAPNIYMATGDALLSTLAVPYPSVVVGARRIDAVDKAPVQERVDNNLIADLKMRRKMEEACLQAFSCGKVLLKIGYDSLYGYDQRFDVGNRETGPVGMTLSQMNRMGERIEFGSAKPGMPWIELCPSQDILVPWGTRHIDDAVWCIHRIIRHIDDVKADPKYEKTRGLQPMLSMEDWTKSYTTSLKPYRIGETISTYGDRDNEGAREFVELWEIRDRRTGKLIVIASGHDKFLRNDVDLLQLEFGLPFVELSFVPHSRNFWVTPDAYYLRPHQAELTDITIQKSKHRKISVLKFLYNRRLISPEELEKALSDKVGLGIEVELNDNRPISDVIFPFQPNPNNQMIMMEEEGVRRNAREVMGFSRNQAGEYEQTGRRTKFEAQVVDNSSRLRMSRRHLAMGDAYIDAINKINSIIYKFWKTPQLVDILDKEGQRKWMKFNGSGLKSEYSMGVTFSNSPPDDMTTRKQVAVQMYMTLMADPTVDQIKLRRYLTRAVNDPNFNTIWKPGILEGTDDAALLAQMPVQKMLGGGQGGGEAVPSVGEGSPEEGGDV